MAGRWSVAALRRANRPWRWLTCSLSMATASALARCWGGSKRSSACWPRAERSSAIRCMWLAWTPGSHVHVIAEDLSARGQHALDLFDPPQQRARAEAVALLKEQVNDRHGRFALRSAATLHLPAIYRDVANAYDICDIRGKICF